MSDVLDALISPAEVLTRRLWTCVALARQAGLSEAEIRTALSGCAQADDIRWEQGVARGRTG